jgi:iron(III) transport system substrate-binding protein
MRRPLSSALLALVLLLGLASASSRAADPGAALAALVTAGKAEGSIVVDGPPVDAIRLALTESFERRYGIPVSYVASSGSARLRAERAAGKYLVDVIVSGSDTPLLTFLPSGWLDRIEPVLVAPDVLNPKVWKDGHLWYADPQHTVLRVIQYVSVELAVNTKLVQPKEVSTWKTLLDPKWQGGKLLVKDPTTSGTGQSLTSYFYINFGPDFVRKLYKDQQPALISDTRQAAQWLAQGSYAVWVGADFGQLEPFIKLGYPIAPVLPTDGPGILTGSYGLISLVNRAPHPNAAKLFVNWLAGREGEMVFAKALGAESLRTDFKQDWVPSYELTRPGVKYYDAYDYKFVTSERQPSLDRVKELLGF